MSAGTAVAVMNYISQIFTPVESLGMEIQTIQSAIAGIHRINEFFELEEKKIDVIHISPSHHFPTGIVVPISRRYELLGWANKVEKHYIIEDDYDSELRLGGKTNSYPTSIDVSDKVIYMNTFTKTLSSTIRMSYMVLPESLADEYYKRLSFYSCTVSNFEQYTLSRFIENGHFERHINRLRNYYLKKQNTILNAFQTSSLDNKIEIYNETTGVHFLMKIKSEKARKRHY